MSATHTVRNALHDATHRIPGVPEHEERAHGHQRSAQHGRLLHHHPQPHRSLQNRVARGTRRHDHRPPRVLVTWQNRVAAFFGQTPAHESRDDQTTP
jgi:hypothetical protein